MRISSSLAPYTAGEPYQRDPGEVAVACKLGLGWADMPRRLTGEPGP